MENVNNYFYQNNILFYTPLSIVIANSFEINTVLYDKRGLYRRFGVKTLNQQHINYQ